MPLPRISSRTPLHDSTLPSHHTDNSSSSFMPHVSNIMSALQPGKQRNRTVLFGLTILAFITTCIFFVHLPFSSSIAIRRPDLPSQDQLALALQSIQHSRLKGGIHSSSSVTQRTQVQLDPSQELAAVSSFLASLPQNVIPLSVDPSKPVDPQLVLDFDTTGPRASEEVQNMVDDVWLRNPVFLYSKLYSPISREVKAILADMRLRPAPTIIDVDVRDDAEVLKPILSRLTSQLEFPILLIGGRPVGTVEQIRELVKSGELKKLVTEAGAVVNGARRKKHRK
ncbi:hypothetical protein BDQ17DRAFT_1346522 [Cyathus striatus]|nr:hypothetical protein BDQ17DRAFT_1346522 [Cyathus striatus]